MAQVMLAIDDVMLEKALLIRLLHGQKNKGVGETHLLKS